jgi:D-cysteine desulfhydrase
MDRLAAHMGRGPGELFVKRDDLTAVAGGGGKVRKLEYVVAGARDSGADSLLTLGGVQSNAVRATAAVARMLGLKAVVILVGTPPTRATGNTLLGQLLGAEIRWCDVDDPRSEAEVLADEAESLRKGGARPWVIPLGASTALGALGYARAAHEILDQCPDADLVVTASGTGATQAGLAVGLGSHERVLGVRIGNRRRLLERVSHLAAEAAYELAAAPPEGVPEIDNDHLGAGYGDHTRASAEALVLAARTEGLVLDPVYTAKSMAALLTRLGDGRIPRGHRVVFLHSGGVPGLFSDHSMRWLDAVLPLVDPV